ncbi:MAG: disulfide bond formation protein B [Gammaproteobacteria bacterium]
MKSAMRGMSGRALALCGALLCITLLAIALYFQHVAGLDPCPLCILQRVAFIAVGVILLAAAAHNPRRRGWRVYAAAAGVVAALGAVVAARHVWLQSLPAERVPECGPGLGYLLDVFPLQRALALILRGSGECAEVQWRLAGLSMPAWSMLWLVALIALAVCIAWRAE